MHQLNVLVLGPNSFINTLIELKSYLKFNLSQANNNLDKNFMDNYDILLFHEEFLENKNNKNIIDNLDAIKILASGSLNKNYVFDALLKLPTNINKINFIVENSAIKKKFIKNSSIKIKNYSLDKNKKKLSKNNSFIILTEKEIQLLELFLNNTSSISKKEILSKVWHYSFDADTHTVETHIYRLRKKINDKFLDDQFILNDRNGYSL
jgi:hypothetical protein|tara:strand:+ start:1632 stop:2255 length:624 start_codon:yes stop_codon:yes gene_type:complete